MMTINDREEYFPYIYIYIYTYDGHGFLLGNILRTVLNYPKCHVHPQWPLANPTWRSMVLITYLVTIVITQIYVP